MLSTWCKQIISPEKLKLYFLFRVMLLPPKYKLVGAMALVCSNVIYKDTQANTHGTLSLSSTFRDSVDTLTAAVQIIVRAICQGAS